MQVVCSQPGSGLNRPLIGFLRTNDGLPVKKEQSARCTDTRVACVRID
jgi:hypothetical protein